MSYVLPAFPARYNGILMHILTDVRLLSKGRISGIEEYTKSLIESLLEEGEKEQFSFFYSGMRKAPLPEAWGARPNVRIVDWKVPNRLLDLSMRLFHAPHIDRRISADIVFSPHFNILPPVRHAKRVVTFHDLSFMHFPEWYPWKKRAWHWLQNYRGQARSAQAIVAVSDFTREDIVRTLGIPEEKVHTIHSGINPLFCEIANDDPRRAAFVSAKHLERPFLLFAGVLEPRKNVSGIIRAFNEVKRDPYHRELQLIIVGRRGWLCDTIFKDAHASPWRSDIRFWGEATYDDLHMLYALASAFVYPSFFEGFGFPPLEAQACGAPVITSNRSSLPEIVGESALTVDPWKTEELVYAIDCLLKNDAMHNALKKKGTENAKRFSWKKSAHSLLSLFRTLAE